MMTKMILSALAIDGALFAVDPRYGAIGLFLVLVGGFVTAVFTSTRQ